MAKLAANETTPLYQHESATSFSSFASSQHSRCIGSSSSSHNNNNNPNHKIANSSTTTVGSATNWQTILTLAKTCMGTGCLGLPFACQQGGLLGFCGGLLAIAFWNVYSVQRLVQCLDYIPPTTTSTSGGSSTNSAATRKEQPHQAHHYDTIPKTDTIISNCHHPIPRPPPPPGTSVLGQVAWYAFGKWGLHILDTLLFILLMGIITAYIAAVVNFWDDITTVMSSSSSSSSQPGDYHNNYTENNNSISSIGHVSAAFGAATIIGGLAASAPDLSHLSKHSAVGLVVLGLTMAVIAGYGIITMQQQQNTEGEHQDFTVLDEREQHLAYATEHSSLHWWPLAGLTGLSHFFGVTVFGFGVVPLTYNYHSAMQNPSAMVPCTAAALTLVALAYAAMGVGLSLLYPHVTTEILHEIPSTGWIPTVTRLAMILVVFMTAPLLVVPCAELVEGKLRFFPVTAMTNDDDDDDDDEFAIQVAPPSPHSLSGPQRACRLILPLICAVWALGVPSLVMALSLVGCTSVGVVGFVLPPLLHCRLRKLHWQQHAHSSSSWTVSDAVDAGFFVWGVTATLISTVYTVVQQQQQQEQDNGPE